MPDDYTTRSTLDDFQVILLGSETSNRMLADKGHYKLIYLAEGSGAVWIDEEKLGMAAPECYFLEPGQVLRWRFSTPPKGYIIGFRPSFYNDVKEMISVHLYHQVFRLSRLCLPPDHRLTILLEEIFRESGHSSGYTVHIIHGLLRTLYAQLLRISGGECVEQNTPISLFNRFTELLQLEGYKVHKVKDLAVQLNCTPQHLNAICRKYARRSAGDLVVAHVLLEAKRLLLHTDNTVQEIALFLSFQDASHFIKFFKRHVSLTPRQFRLKQFQ